MEISENTKNEIIKSHVYGMSYGEIAELYGVPENDVKMFICERHEDVEAEKAYRSKLTRG